MIEDFITHPIFISVVTTTIVAGLIKYFVGIYRKEQKSIWWQLVRTGGMPSAHAAAVTTVILNVYFIEGISTLFFVTSVLGLIVIRDSFGVRWSVGQQAKIINKIIEHDHMHDSVKVILGHTMLQTFWGVVLGALVAMIVHSL